YLNAKGALTYTDIAGDPVLYGNLPPREISMKDVFRSGDSSKKFKIAEGHLFQGYLNIYNNYFKAPWMPDRTEANPNELNQDDARYGFRCCHLKNIWTAPLPPETELS